MPPPDRRDFLWLTAGVAGLSLTRAAATEPTANPAAHLTLPWTDQIRWGTGLDVTRSPGETIAEKLAHAQAVVVMRGGGVVYFPPGTYRFADSIKLKNGVVLRGADPGPVTKAHDEKYDPPTRFEFPKYEPTFEGDGAPIATAFKGVYAENPATDSNIGLVNISVNRGHVHLDDDHSEHHKAGSNRIVFGCVFRNAAVADPAVPNLKLGQKPWQRFTRRHFAAIDVKAEKNVLVANNRLPKSGDDDFAMTGYVLRGPKNAPATMDGVVFDYDNRPGVYVNHYALGGAGGNGPDGTPETHPFAFRSGIVIRDNSVFNTGRMAIGFAGDGVRCEGNVVRFPADVWRPTVTGQNLATGSSTNDNRAVEMRGWRWVVANNDYVVHRNWAADRKYRINDGEGLMHEDHVNSTVKDSVLTGNRGNTYLSIYKMAGIDGLLVEGNDIRLGDGKQTIAGGSAIYVSADRNSGRHPCRRVRIVNNTVSGGGILIAGEPASANVVKGNRCVGPKAKIVNKADAVVEGNENFEATGSS